MFNKEDFTEQTPIEEHGGCLVKRDDRFTINSISGGKVRGCWRLSVGASGLVTASSRSSPQAVIVARIAQRRGIPCRLHMPQGKETPEMVLAKAAGGEIVQHKAGYNNVIIARAKADVKDLNGTFDGNFSEKQWAEIPFGMESRQALKGTANEVQSLCRYKKEIKRIVVPVGSGMSLAGILHGLSKLPSIKQLPILGIAVGADPNKRLQTYAPPLYQSLFNIKIVNAGMDYHTPCEDKLGDLPLDPIYEAKCVKFLEKGDLLWVVGVRPSTVENYFRNEKANNKTD